jgi:hypothetical protein
MKVTSFSFTKNIKRILLAAVGIIVWIVGLIIVGFLFVILIDFLGFKSIFLEKDGFTTLEFWDGGGKSVSLSGGSWSKSTILQFIQFQKTKNPLLIFDMDLLQKNASEREAIELLTTGQWPWSPVVQQIYQDAIVRDTNRQINPLDSMNKDRSIYCEAIMKDMLAFKAPEGQFLLYGVLVKNRSGSGSGPGSVAESSGEGTYGENSGLISQSQDLIRCRGSSGMQKISWSGYDGITGVRVKNIENLNYTDLPSVVPGFTFLNGPCNPCDALSDDPLKKYRCPFVLERENGNGNGGYYKGIGAMSDIWRVLWGFANYFKTSSAQVPAEFSAFRVNT